MKRNFKIPFWLTFFLFFFSVAALAKNYNTYMPYQSPSYWADRMSQHLLVFALGGLIGAFFSEKFRKFRKWICLIVVALGFVGFALLDTLTGNIAAFIAGFIVVYTTLKEIFKRQKQPKITTLGSAEWADLAHLQENNLIGEKGFSLGHYAEGSALYPIHYTGDRHLLTVAPTRSGKGTSSIIPNLLTYDGSVIVIDPKGENARITADRRGTGEKLKIEGMGQEVHVVDPWGITGMTASCFNPVDWLRPDDEDINENAMILADAIVLPHQGASDPFWDEEAKALLMGILLYVSLNEEEAEQRTLGRVRDIICMGEIDFADIMQRMQESDNPIVSSTAARTLSKEQKLLSNVLAVLQGHTHFLDSPRIRESLTKSDFKFEDLKTNRITIYLVLPSDRLDTFGRWLRLLIQQAITVNARNIETKPDKPILFILDEMAALGRLSMVEQAFGLMAGFGMQLWGIVQDLSQLERIYEKGWETFIGNSGVLQYFGSRDHKTAEYFSKLCGVTTVQKFSLTRAIARALGVSSSNSSSGGNLSITSGSNSSTTNSESTTEDIVQRNLAFPDELMVLRNNNQLILIENFNPIPSKKRHWYEDRKMNKLGLNLHTFQENRVKIEQLLKDENKKE